MANEISNWERDPATPPRLAVWPIAVHVATTVVEPGYLTQATSPQFVRPLLCLYFETMDDADRFIRERGNTEWRRTWTFQYAVWRGRDVVRASTEEPASSIDL
jgi:hypothetical protein